MPRSLVSSRRRLTLSRASAPLLAIALAAPPLAAAGAQAGPAGDLETRIAARQELAQLVRRARAAQVDLSRGFTADSLRAALADGATTPRAAASATIPIVDDARVKRTTASGTVTSTGGARIKGASVQAYMLTSSGGFQYVGVATTNPKGAFTIRSLPLGTYTFIASQSGYVDQVFSGVNCGAGDSCSLQNATRVTLAKAPRKGIDFRLTAARRVTVSLVDRGTGAPLPYGSVQVHDGTASTSLGADANGRVTFDALDGTLWLTGFAPGHVTVLGDGRPCYYGICATTAGPPIQLQGNASFTLALPASAVLRGRVTRARDGVPLPDLLVAVGHAGVPAFNTWVYAFTDADGRYAIEVPAGGYDVAVTDFYDGLGFDDRDLDVRDEMWPATACPDLLCASLDRIRVAAGETRDGLDFALPDGATIDARLVDGATGQPVTGATVFLIDGAGYEIGYGSPDADGRVHLDGLPTGRSYFYVAGGGRIVQIADDLLCPSFSCDLANAHEIRIQGTEAIDLGDVALRAGGRIQGAIVDADTGAPVRGLLVRALTRNYRRGAGSSRTNQAGAFNLSGLPADRYWLEIVADANTPAQSRDYVQTIVPGIPCPGRVCSFAGAGSIQVGDGETVSGIGAAVRRGGSISGSALAPDGSPLAFGQVVIEDAAGNTVVQTTADGAGFYHAGGLPDGAWYARTGYFSGAVGARWNGHLCPLGSCSGGDPIVVANGGSVDGIDIVSGVEQGRISGRLVDGATGEGASGCTAFAVDAQGAFQGTSDVTGPSGEFLIAALPARDDLRVVGNCPYNGYLDRAHASVPCPTWDRACPAGNGATVFSLANGQEVDGLEIALSAAATLGGRVTAAANGQPIPFVGVEVYDGTGRLVSRSSTDLAGRWRSRGLPAGSYRAATVGTLDYTDRVFGGGACEAGCNPASGGAITLGSSAVTNVDFSLSP